MVTAAAGSLFVGIDPRAREPLQVQLYQCIRRAILDGILAPGARLPSSRALASDVGLSRTTVVLAYDQLLAEGYLTSRTGSGTFVTQDLPDDRPREPAMVRGRPLSSPPPSRRGLAVAGTRPTVIKIDGPPRAFRIGTPALDRFPIQLWARLASRRSKSVTIGQLDYSDLTGLPALREAIADHLRRARGTTCTADQIVVVAGAQHALDLISRVLLDPGDVVWMEEPGYPGAHAALVAAGARIRPIPVDAQGLNVALGVRRASSARLAYVTPSHQFPLGVPMSLSRRLALLAWARAARAWVIEDDYDSEFRYAARPMPCLHGLDVDGRVIYIGTFSKTLFPALRLGFLVVPPGLHDPLLAARRASDIHAAKQTQAILADLMIAGHYERHLRRMRTEYRARLDALTTAANHHGRGALRLHTVTAGLHAVADLLDTDERLVAREALTRGVEVMPLSAYRFDRRTRSANALVLGFGAIAPDLLDTGMKRLIAAIDNVRHSAHRD